MDQVRNVVPGSSELWNLPGDAWSRDMFCRKTHGVIILSLKNGGKLPSNLGFQPSNMGYK
jgi:hypothetical protein